MRRPSDAPEAQELTSRGMFANLLLRGDLAEQIEREGINTRLGVSDVLLQESDLSPTPTSTYVTYGEIGARDAWESTPLPPETKE